MRAKANVSRRLPKAPAITLMAAAIGAASLGLSVTATAASLKEAGNETSQAAGILESARLVTAEKPKEAQSQPQSDEKAAKPAPAQAPNDLPRGQFHLPESGDVIGKPYTVTVQDQEQTLIDIAREHNIGYEEIRMANPDISLWVPGEGTEVVIPSRYILPDEKREGIVINLSELRLYYYPADKPGIVETYPVSVGREEFATPVGVTKTTIKVKDPAWAPPASMRREAAERGEPAPEVVPPGPNNPLGEHAILLGIPSYLIHGTNRPEGVGMRVSRGCIRMYPEDIESLYERVPKSTRVNIIDAPFKAGLDEDGSLLVQSFPQLEENSANFEPVLNALETIEQQTGGEGIEVDYKRVKQAIESPDGSIVALTGPQAQPTQDAETQNTATLLKELKLESGAEKKADKASES